MSDSYVLVVEKAICDHLESKLNLTVYRGRGRFGREPVPMVSLLQAAEVDESFSDAENAMRRKDDKLYLIQGWVSDDRENPTDPAHDLLAKTKQALSEIIDMDSPKYLLKGYNSNNNGRSLVGDLKISTGIVRPPEQGVSDTAYFWLPIRVTLLENLADPYQLP